MNIKYWRLLQNSRATRYQCPRQTEAWNQLKDEEVRLRDGEIRRRENTIFMHEIDELWFSSMYAWSLPLFYNTCCLWVTLGLIVARRGPEALWVNPFWKRSQHQICWKWFTLLSLFYGGDLQPSILFSILWNSCLSGSCLVFCFWSVLFVSFLSFPVLRNGL